MPRCCNGNLPPKINSGRHIDVEGIGTPDDPLSLTVTTDLSVNDNDQFVLLLSGTGELDQPWRLEVLYAPTAKLSGLPDVDPTGLANGDTLLWNSSTQTWQMAPAPTATPGAILHGNGVNGDGSAGAPLVAVGDVTRYIQITSAGIGLTNTALRELVRPYANDAARTAETVAPVEGSISVLTTEPGTLWEYISGTWKRISGVKYDASGQLMSLSGAYAGGPVTMYSRQLAFTTASDGTFTIIPAGSLGSYSGVLSAVVQPTGSTAWQMGTVRVSSGALVGTAYHMDGTVYAAQPLTGTLTAHLYV